MQLNFEVVVLTSKDSKDTQTPEGVKFLYRLDFSSEENLAKSILENNIPKPDLIIGSGEASVIKKAWLLKFWDITGISNGAAEACTDKIIMRSKFKDYEIKTGKIFSPQFSEVKSEQDLIDFAKSHSFPLILKPANLFKSILVTKNDNLDELLSNYRSGINEIQNEYINNQIIKHLPRFIIEEYLEGKMCSVEAFVNRKGECFFAPTIFDLTTGQDIGINDNFCYFGKLPTDFTENQMDELRETAQLGINALGLTNSAAHVELFFTKNGPRIIEIGARLGGMRHKIFKMAYGISLIQSEALINLDLEPELDRELVAYVSLYELYPEQDGEYVETLNWDKLLALKSIYSAYNFHKPGDKIGLSKHGHKARAGLTTRNTNVEEFLNDNLFIQKQVRIIVK